MVVRSVRLSVWPSHTCFVTKPNNSVQIFWYHTKGKSLYFPHTDSGWWVAPVWNLCSKWPSLFEKRRLRQISAYNVSTVRDSKKVQWWRIGSRSRAFQWAIDGVRTLPLSPQRVAQSQLQSNKVCYKVSLCENFQRQNCSMTIPVSKGP